MHWHATRTRIETDAESLEPWQPGTALETNRQHVIEEATKALHDAGYVSIQPEPARPGHAASAVCRTRNGQIERIVIPHRTANETLCATGLRSALWARVMNEEHFRAALQTGSLQPLARSAAAAPASRWYAAHQGSLLRSVRAGPGTGIGSSHRVLPHAETRELAEHRGERTELDDAPMRARAPRIGDLGTLHDEVSAWSTDVNGTQRGVDWQMKVDDARCKLKSVYPHIIT